MLPVWVLIPMVSTPSPGCLHAGPRLAVSPTSVLGGQVGTRWHMVTVGGSGLHSGPLGPTLHPPLLARGGCVQDAGRVHAVELWPRSIEQKTVWGGGSAGPGVHRPHVHLVRNVSLSPERECRWGPSTGGPGQAAAPLAGRLGCRRVGPPGRTFLSCLRWRSSPEHTPHIHSRPRAVEDGESRRHRSLSDDPTPGESPTEPRTHAGLHTHSVGDSFRAARSRGCR